MSDLMTGTCTYDELVNKYANFHVPAARLYVNGKDAVQELKLDIRSMDISLSLNTESTAVIRLVNLYDRESRSFDSKVKNKFKLGTVVEVGIGYMSEIQKVLKGYVAALGAEFGENTCLVVTVADVRRLMMTGGVHHVLHAVDNYSDAVRTILDQYSKLCTAEIDATSDQLDRPLSQQSTDYDFITRELIGRGRCEREFFVSGDTAYFREPCKEKAAICTMELGRELLQFSVETGYVDLQVDVTGYNQQEQSIVTATATAKQVEAQSSVLANTPVHNIVDPEADTQDKADLRAKAYAGGRQASGKSGRGTCVGLPELIPGRFVEIVMLEELANQKYYISSVTHKMDQDGFFTEFEAGGGS